MFTLSDLAIERDRHKQTCLPSEDRLCCHGVEGAVEIESRTLDRVS